MMIASVSRFTRMGFLLLLMAWFTSGAVSAAEPKTLLVLGDSLSAAYGLDSMEDGWVALLQRRLGSEQWHIINASISGDTSAGGDARLPGLLKLHNPDLVILELGANDGLRGLPLSAFRQHLEHMVQISQASGAQVMLFGMKLPPNYGDRYNAEFESVYADVASAHHLPWMPFWMVGMGWKAEYLQEDQLHPNAAAQPVLLEGVWPALLPVLESLCGGKSC